MQKKTTKLKPAIAKQRTINSEYFHPTKNIPKLTLTAAEFDRICYSVKTLKLVLTPHVFDGLPVCRLNV